MRLSTALTDGAGRSFIIAGGESFHALEWTVPTGTPEIPEPPVIFEQRFGLRYDTHLAAAGTVGGRFPGGQTTLFQGLWTDPVTGIAYARARWYDSRNASWLSEDPMADVDSPNLYAFVAWQPNIATDPFGECWFGHCEDGSQSMAGVFWEGFKEGFGGSVDSIFELLSHPLEIPRTVADGVLTILGDGPHLLGEGIKALVMASPEERARMLGNLAGGVAFDMALERVGTVDKVASGVVRANRIRKFADLAMDATRIRRVVDGVTDARRMAGRAHDTRSAVRHLDEIADMLPSNCIVTRCLTGNMRVENAEGLGPIKEIKIGGRIITTEESYFGETAVDEATWKAVRVRMPAGANASDVKLEFLSSPEWIAAMGAKVGQEIWLELPGSGLAGFGVVEAVEPCPVIEDGPGRVVLATISVRSEDVVQVRLKGLDEPLEATADHPVYSVTREAWVGAGELLAGEKIWALGDTALVLEVDSKSGAYSVFNLEVEGEHVFFVSDLRVLSHNVSSRCPTGILKAGGGLHPLVALGNPYFIG